MPIAHPLVLRQRADGAVEVDGRLVPVQHAPLQASAVVGHGLAGQLAEQPATGADATVSSEEVVAARRRDRAQGPVAERLWAFLRDNATALRESGMDTGGDDSAGARRPR